MGFFQRVIYLSHHEVGIRHEGISGHNEITCTLSKTPSERNLAACNLQIEVDQYSMTAAYILLILFIDDVGEQNAQQHCAV